MSDTVITLTLPERIYQQVSQIAHASGQPLDAVMLETFALLSSQPLALPADTTPLASYTDTQLWAVAYRRLPDAIDARWRELLGLRRERPLAEHEAAELESFVEMNDLYVLHRSEALRLLKGRGYDIDAYLDGS